MKTTKEFQQDAEEYIDSSSLANAICELAEVCEMKAQHLNENWQDAASAAVWRSLARSLMVVEKRAADHGI